VLHRPVESALKTGLLGAADINNHLMIAFDPKTGIKFHTSRQKYGVQVIEQEHNSQY
jgi:hypothetical protein